ncbi:glutathione S-transferase family protein [Ideonella sp. BN130291]|uniref:glutathione S-transferase family protein n=1 Tax=Ideonella sp. BN130291 TaxID=3112940 RepID=UPI002E276101|nr:glutathione S-transferase family protein [Ideonella sp. BN130291]
MITVYKYGPVGRTPDLSPFVLKLETWLRMAGIPYTGALGGRAMMPKGKLPVIDDDGQRIADSSLIIRHLERKHGDPLGEAQRSPQDRAMAVAMKALFETHLYFTAVHLRWSSDANFEHLKPLLLDYAVQTSRPLARTLLPRLAPLLMPAIRKKTLAQLHAQGIGRHQPQEIVQIALEGWQAVADFLGDKPYMLGDTPSGLDAIAFAFIHTASAPPFEHPVREQLQRMPNVMAYHDRMWQRYWAGGTAAAAG